jgi:hypothetical protein
VNQDQPGRKTPVPYSERSVKFRESVKIDDGNDDGNDDGSSEYSSEADDIFDDYYSDARSSHYPSRISYLPKITIGNEDGKPWWRSSKAHFDASRPYSAFSIGRLVDMYALNSPIAGMGSPVSPNGRSSVMGGRSSILGSTKAKQRQPSFSPVKTRPFNSAFSFTPSKGARRVLSPQPPCSPSPVSPDPDVCKSLVPPVSSSFSLPPPATCAPGWTPPTPTPSPPPPAQPSMLQPPHTIPLQRPLNNVPRLDPQPLNVRRRVRGMSLYSEIMRMEPRSTQPTEGCISSVGPRNGHNYLRNAKNSIEGGKV